MISFEQVMSEFSPKDRKEIEEQAKVLIAEEMTLQELRKAHKLTQAKLGAMLGIGQEGISRLEKRSDLLLSTLQEYVHGMGGNLSIVAKFPDKAPVIISGIGTL